MLFDVFATEAQRPQEWGSVSPECLILLFYLYRCLCRDVHLLCGRRRVVVGLFAGRRRDVNDVDGHRSHDVVLCLCLFCPCPYPGLYLCPVCHRPFGCICLLGPRVPDVPYHGGHHLHVEMNGGALREKSPVRGLQRKEENAEARVSNLSCGSVVGQQAERLSDIIDGGLS